MQDIFSNATAAATEYGNADDLVMGANIAGMMKIADAMLSQGVAY
jgi:glutamate dehydrogenase (NADP+)